jgi:hypothetical protein
VIPGDTVNLPVCAFGAGLAHAAVLALVLPIMITLPAPGADTAPGPVAIQVEIRAAPPEAPIAQDVTTEDVMSESLMAEGDAEESGEAMDLRPSPDAVEVTGALPDVGELAALPEPVEASVPDELPDELPDEFPETDGAGPEPAADAEPRALASIGPDVPAATVPFPLRKPRLTVEARDENEDAAKPAPKRRASVSAPAPRARAPAKSQPAYKGILGGRRATAMPEYPSPGQPFGNRQ